jgi:competence protein ComEA
VRRGGRPSLPDVAEDEETVVRRRLRRLLEDPASQVSHGVTAGRPPARADPPSIAPDPRLVAPDPPRIADVRPATEDAPAGPSASRLPGPGAFDPGRRGVRALAAVAVLVVLGAGLWAWRSRPHAEPVGALTSVAAPESPSGPGPIAPASAAGTPAGELVVAVAGKVRRPGLVRVPAGARVADAVEAAGGALPGVDVALLNPARRVTDGELILVGVAAPAGQPGAAAPPAGPGGPAAGGGAVPGAPVNLNTATLAQLDALPGVGPVLAQRILTHREQHGGFRSVGDLRQVEGIGDARYEQLKELVTV